MALPLAAGLAIGSGIAGIGSTLLNARSQKKANQMQIDFQQDMWNKTNKYNDPSQQMSRLKAAGLNPNLIYGSSSSAAAGNASMAGKPDIQAQDYSGIGSALSGGVAQYYQLENTQAGTEATQARAKLTEQETLNAALESLSKTIRNSKDSLSYKQQKELYDTQVQSAKANLQNVQANTQYRTNEDARAEATTKILVPKLKEELKYLKKKGEILSDEQLMKRMDRLIQQETGMRPNDPHFYRLLQSLKDAIDVDASQIFQRGPLREAYDFFKK